VLCPLDGGLPVSLGPLRAPRDDGSVLAEPPLAEAGRLLADNRRLFADTHLQIFGKPLAELRELARQEVLAAAHAYFCESGEPVPSGASASLLLAGHQPELHHPGVWVKNFALAGLARQHSSTALNLVVDNDTVKSTALRFPVHSGPSGAYLETIAFDEWNSEVPYEERPVHDEALFASFAERASAVTGAWNFPAMLPRFWSEVSRQAQRTSLLGERFAAARRSFERQWGCHNLELPVSRLSQTKAFAWFACHLGSELLRFHETYNAALHDHRRRHGIRSKNHPVPDLLQEGGWLELPFWGWRAGSAQRARLFARPGAGTTELRAGSDVWPALSGPGNPEACVQAWRHYEEQGFKIRPRALTMTMFARLMVGDLFIHGIGGAHYDELTDEIIRRFYGIEPPAFMVLSATLLLPLERSPVSIEDQHRLQRTVRDLHYNPQRHLASNGSVGELMAAKRHWVERQPADRAERRQRFETIRRLNQQLAPFVKDQETAATDRLEKIGLQLAANAILQRRDYAFCLHPEEKLRSFYATFLR
jgi:hypothetical protein